MAVTVAAVGAFSTSTSLTPAVSLPAGITAGDLLLIQIEDQTNSTNDPTATGWTLIFSALQTAATGSTKLAILARIADGTEGTSVTLGLGAATTNNHLDAISYRITGHGVSNVATDIVVGTVSQGAASGTSPQTNTVTGITVAANSLVLICASTALDLNQTNAQFSAWTNANLTGITEYADNGTNLGNGGGIGMAAGTYTAGGATGSSTYSQATTEAYNAVHLGIPPASTGTTFNDSGSGTITLSGSATAAHTVSDSASGTITFSGSRSESWTGQANGTGTIFFGGSGSETYVPGGTNYTDSGSGTIALSGSATTAFSISDHAVGTITLSGSGTDAHTEHIPLTGTITLTGFAVEVYSNGAPVTAYRENGFWRDINSLALIVGTAPGSMEGGFLRQDAEGLIFGVAAPTVLGNAFLRDATYALVQDTGGAGTWVNGFLRDASGALITVLLQNAVAPVSMQNGFLRDANGALVLK